MAEAISLRQRLVIRAGAILWTLLVALGALGLATLYVLPWWMLGLIAAAGLVLGAVAYLPRWLLRRNDPTFSPRLALLKHALGGLLLAIGLASLPIYFVAAFVTSGPTALPLATLSNGKKTIVFQGMQHIGSEDFYKAVVFDLEKALTEGYTLFYEGVQPVPDRPDLTRWFDETLRGSKKDLNASYKQLADSCGLTFQLTYFDPLLADKAVHPSRHVTADVSYLDMKTEYDRLIREDPAFAAAIAAERAAQKPDEDDSTLAILAAVGSASREQKRLIGILCRGVMGMTIAGSAGKDKSPMQRVILDFRNRALAQFVAQSPADKIYITYGAAHFPGFLKELQALDPAVRVQSLRWVRPMTLPNEPEAPAGYPVTR